MDHLWKGVKRDVVARRHYARIDEEAEAVEN